MSVRSSWALLTFLRPSSAKAALDHDSWKAEVRRKVEAWGIGITTVDIDKAMGSTGAFGEIFQKARKGVAKQMRKIQKRRDLEALKSVEKKDAKARLYNESAAEERAAAAQAATRERQHCLCPLSRLPMRNPVVAADGFVYERAAILRWFETQGDTAVSPVTEKPLENRLLIPHQALRAAAADVEATGHMQGYGASLRAAERLAGGVRWDGRAPPVIDREDAQAALQHGIRRNRTGPRDVSTPPSSSRRPGKGPARRPGRSLRTRRPGSATARSPRRSPKTPRPQSAGAGGQSKPWSATSSFAKSERSDAAGLGGGGGTAERSPQLSSVELAGVSPRLWPATPHRSAKRIVRPRQQPPSPQRESPLRERLGFGSASQVARQPGFKQPRDPALVAEQAQQLQAEAVARAGGSEAAVLAAPRSPRSLWSSSAAAKARAPERAARPGSELLQAWHAGNDGAGTQ